MKRTLFLSFLILITSVVAYSQNTNDIFNALKDCRETNRLLKTEKTILSDSLKSIKNSIKIYEQKKEIGEKRKIRISDSITLCRSILNTEKRKPSTYNARIVKLSDSINMMRKKNEDLTDTILNLQKRIQRDKGILSKEDNEYKKELRDAETQMNKAREDGKQKGMDSIKKMVWEKYSNKKKFDYKIYSVKDFVAKDQAIIRDSVKIDMLVMYYEAKTCLEHRYDANQLAKSKKQVDLILKQFPNSLKAKELKTALTNYQTINERFEKLIADMDAYNEKNPGLTDKVRDNKKMKFMGMISNFIGSEEDSIRFSFDMYPYISNKLVELMVLKNKNDDDNVGEGVNKNVSYMLNN